MCAQSSEPISICQWMSILVAFRWIVNEQYNNNNNDQYVHSRFEVITAIVIRRLSNLATLYTLFMLIFIGSGYLFAYLHWNGIIPFRHMLIWIIYDFLDIAWNVYENSNYRYTIEMAIRMKAHDRSSLWCWLCQLCGYFSESSGYSSFTSTNSFERTKLVLWIVQSALCGNHRSRQSDTGDYDSYYSFGLF